MWWFIRRWKVSLVQNFKKNQKNLELSKFWGLWHESIDINWRYTGYSILFEIFYLFSWMKLIFGSKLLYAIFFLSKNGTRIFCQLNSFSFEGVYIEFNIYRTIWELPILSISFWSSMYPNRIFNPEFDHDFFSLFRAK